MSRYTLPSGETVRYVTEIQFHFRDFFYIGKRLHLAYEVRDSLGFGISETLDVLYTACRTNKLLSINARINMYSFVSLVFVASMKSAVSRRQTPGQMLLSFASSP